MILIDEKPLVMLQRHCNMYLFGSMGSEEPMKSEIAQDFYSFALLHLICTMFITTDHPDKTQGIFHRILDPINKGELLSDIDTILDSKLGNTTLRNYIRAKRNKLATHGNGAFSSQPQKVKDVIFDDNSLHQYVKAMTKLDDAVSKLKEKLNLYLSYLQS